MDKGTWKSITAGILTIVAGVFGLTRILHPFRSSINSGPPGIIPHPIHPPISPRMPGIMPHTFNFMGHFYLPIAIAVGLLGILAIVGGVYALKRRIWGLALAGSIAAIFGSFPLGIAGLVLTVLSKTEFESSQGS